MKPISKIIVLCFLTYCNTIEFKKLSQIFNMWRCEFIRIYSKYQLFMPEFQKYSNLFKTMKEVLIIFIFVNVSNYSYSQNDIQGIDKLTRDRFIIRLIPSAATNIYGIAIGPVGSEVLCKRYYTKFSHGLNIQIPGQGFLQTFYIGIFYRLNFFDTLYVDTIPSRAIHNGLLISLLGTFTDRVNGISCSFWMSMGKKINGLTANLFWNVYRKVNGVSIGCVNFSKITNGMQIGLYNRSQILNGLQIGLWNRNGKRSLPFINWGFTKK
jgi:hypothetical protein